MTLEKWDRRFLELAKFVSGWSKDTSTKVGAVIADESNRICSIGFNGFPRGCDDNSDLYADRDLKYGRMLHAEQNALLFTPKRDLVGHTIYTYPLPPCNRCALEIIQMGVKRVVSLEPTSEVLERWGESFELTRKLFEETNVEMILVKPKEVT